MSKWGVLCHCGRDPAITSNSITKFPFHTLHKPLSCRALHWSRCDPVVTFVLHLLQRLKLPIFNIEGVQRLKQTQSHMA